MSSPASAIGTRAAPVTFKWQDREIEIKPIDWANVVSGMTNFLIERQLSLRLAAMEPMVRKGLLPPEVMLERQLQFADEIEKSGEYAFGGSRMMSIFRAAHSAVNGQETPQDEGVSMGLLKLWSLMTGLTVNETMEIMSNPAAKTEFLTKVVMVMGRSLPDMSAPDPKARAVDLTPIQSQTGWPEAVAKAGL